MRKVTYDQLILRILDFIVLLCLEHLGHVWQRSMLAEGILYLDDSLHLQRINTSSDRILDESSRFGWSKDSYNS